jgi:hypothetical protein
MFSVVSIFATGFGVRWQSEATSPLWSGEQSSSPGGGFREFQSGVALRFPTQSKTLGKSFPAPGRCSDLRRVRRFSKSFAARFTEKVREQKKSRGFRRGSVRVKVRNPYGFETLKY